MLKDTLEAAKTVKEAIKRELQCRKNLYWRKKCGVRNNIFDYFEKK